MFRKMICLASFVLVLSLVGDVQADIVWTDASGDHLWSTAANWEGGIVPTAVDHVQIGMLPGPTIVNEGAVGNCIKLGLENTTSALTIDGGTLVTSGWMPCAWRPNSNATLNLISGSLTIGYNFNLANGNNSIGTLNVSGGWMKIGGQNYNILTIGYGNSSTAHVNLDGGVITASDLTVRRGTGSVGTMNITGGTLILEGDKVSKVQGYIDNGWITAYGGSGMLQLDYDVTNVGKTTLKGLIPVDVSTVAELEAAAANPGDMINLAAGTYYLTSQIEIKDGVTYKGAGAGLTIIDGNNVTRAFAAWGDRGATNGQVDANGLSVPNATGPKDWVLDGMTIQNCVADTEDRHDILSAARDLLNNYTGTPYTLVAAQAENGGIEDNPGWFDILSGSADDDLTDVELQAYLDGNPVGSAGHLVANDDQSGDGGAITIDNQAVGTIQNCEFLNNHTPIPGDGDDGGAINITGLSVVTINDCLFDGNYACSPTSVAETDETGDADGDGGHIKLQGSTPTGGFLIPGTTLIVNRCFFLNGNAEDDGGAIQESGQGTVARLDSCWFEGNTSWDNGNVLAFQNENHHEVTVTNCVFVNNITKADNSPDRMIETRRNSKFINCTFVGNNQNDQDLIYNNADSADGDNDGVDDEMADTTQVVNCIFANNVVGNGDDVLGSRNNNFTIAATNCLFFDNTLQNGNAADNTQRPDVETGSVLADPLLDANYAPGAGSPAIDAGLDPAIVGVTLTTDFNGDPRPQGAAYDIGAFEASTQ